MVSFICAADGSKKLNNNFGKQGRWRVDESQPTIKKYQTYGMKEPIEVPNFRMTREYAKFLRSNCEKLENHELRVLREKLKFQLEQDGECDPMDLALYMRLTHQDGSIQAKQRLEAQKGEIITQKTFIQQKKSSFNFMNPNAR